MPEPRLHSEFALNVPDIGAQAIGQSPIVIVGPLAQAPPPHSQQPPRVGSVLVVVDVDVVVDVLVVEVVLVDVLVVVDVDVLVVVETVTVVVEVLVVLDELVEVDEGYYLGKALLKWRAGWVCAAYFTLEADTAEATAAG